MRDGEQDAADWLEQQHEIDRLGLLRLEVTIRNGSAPDFGLSLQLLRHDRGYTQQQLADLAGVKLRTIQQSESGRSNPTTRTLDKLAPHFGVAFSYVDWAAHPVDPIDLKRTPPADAVVVRMRGTKAIEFGPTLKRLRKAAGLTQKQLPTRPGQHGATLVSRCERGAGGPGRRVLEQWATPLGVTFHYQQETE